MSFRDFRQAHLPAVILSTMVATLFAGVAGTASAASGGACPGIGSLGDFLAASNVAASFSNSTTDTTYKFISLTNENPVGGVPGLVKYCVYPSPATQPETIVVLAKGANGAEWNSTTGSDSFSFVRPGGNKSNIPLDGKTTVMGTAIWGTTPPSDQTILLHIADAAVCQSLYGGDASTCFVRPSLASSCTNGDTTLAYNAMPYGVVNCGPPSHAFEGNFTNELGDEVTLAGSARTLDKLEVVFNSYACSDSGSWDGVKNGAPAPCVTTPGASFTIDVTANIYDPNGSGGLATPIATVTQPQTFAYRPSADPVCASDPIYNDPSAWFNPLKFGVGGCQYSIVEVHTFTFSAPVTLPDTVVWSVAFNTTNSGYAPILSASCNGNNNNPGCGYDSLNVGTMSFTGAPYSGTDVSVTEADRSWLTNDFQSVTWPSADRPLGRIITK